MSVQTTRQTIATRLARLSQLTPLAWTTILVYALSIVLANWMIRTVGLPIPGGTHLLPVGFGLFAPSGTIAATLTLSARDVVQRLAGRGWSIGIILLGAGLTAFLDVRLALASGGAFLFGELADYLIYTRLQRRGLAVAVAVSTLLAAFIDSVLFLGLAGIPYAIALPGLLVGRVEVAAVVFLSITALRRVLPTPAARQRGVTA